MARPSDASTRSMESRGQIVLYEPVTGLLTFRVGKLSPDQLETLEKLNRGQELDITYKVHREKRSTDSNAYMWKLLSLMAEKLKSSRDEVYEVELQRYGYLDNDIIITVKAEVNMDKVPGHWRLIRTDNTWSGYVRIRGTSEYDSAEMGHFLDMVVQDAKDLGIETDSPEKIEEYKRLFDKYYGCNTLEQS